MELKTEKKGEKKKMDKSSKTILILSILLGLLLVGLTAYYFYQQDKIREAQTLAEKREVTTTKVRKGNLNVTLDDITGTVRSNQSVYLYWQTSGAVLNVYAKIGQNVSKGDVLAELDPSSIDNAIVQAAVTAEKKEEELDRLYTSSTELAQALSAVTAKKSAVKKAQDAYDALGVVRSDLIELGVKYQDWQNAITDYNLAMEAFEKLRDRPLDDTDRINAKNMVDFEKSNMDKLKGEYNWYNGEANPLETQKAEAALLLAQAEYNDAVRAYEKIKNGPTDSQVRKLKAEIDSAKATVKTSKIISPIDGTVAQVEAKPFDVISYESANAARNVLAVRVDDLSAHYLDITVSELDINAIFLGQEVAIDFDAIPLREYSGTITNISNSGAVADQSVTYLLTVKMNAPDEMIKSGMMANIKIVTQEVKDALYVPMQAVMISEDGKRILQKKMADGAFQDTPVSLGISSGMNIQIISEEIHEGDEVRLKKEVFSGYSMMMDGEVEPRRGERRVRPPD